MSRVNPYVGPRAFRPGEALYGRDRELVDLFDTLIAERIVLLCSPSGAGKTSLIQAALLLKLKEDFEVLGPPPQLWEKRPPILRVNQAPPPGTRRPAESNRYLFSVMLYLEQTIPDQARLKDLASTDFAAYLDRHEANGSSEKNPILIFDQFEEVLTLDPTDVQAKAAFFDQVGDALRDRRRWALFAIREEFLGALEPYLRSIPTQLRTRFRLDFLTEAEARKAVQLPAEREHVTFTDTAATLLVDDLRRIQVQLPEGTVERRLGPYVEPVELQVVCERLWDGLPEEVGEITSDAVRRIGNVDTALSDYYAEKVAAIAKETGVKERSLREWFDRELITERGIRGQVLQQPSQSPGLDNRAIWALVDAHLVRAEQRLGATWFELAHDRLIDPVRKSNADWYQATLSPLQIQADLWARNNRPDEMLLGGDSLKHGETWAESHQDELAVHEKDFISACRKARAIGNRQRLQRWVIRFLALGVVVIILAALYMQWHEHRPWGYLRDLSTGKTYKLAGYPVSIGRSSPDITNTVNTSFQHVSDTFRQVSRVHLLIDSNWLASDMRSLNGTSLNSQFMYYGHTMRLHDDDILVLAGIAVFQFESMRYYPLQFWEPSLGETGPPTGAWGIVIDGSEKKFRYLTAKSTSVGVGADGGLTLGTGEGQKPVLSVDEDPHSRSGFTITVESHEAPLRATLKEGDYTYVSCRLAVGTPIEVLNSKKLLDTGECTYPLRRGDYPEFKPGDRSLSGIQFDYGKSHFEIVKFSQ